MKRSTALSIGKYVAAFLLLGLIVHRAGFSTIMGYLQRIPPVDLVLSFVYITLAIIASALRMRFFFHHSGFPMSARYAIILYYVGGFYNFLLPGGIGGDAYKVFLAKRRLSVTTRQGIRIMLADRASGLCILMFMMLGGLMLFDFSEVIPYARALLAAGIIITLIGYLFFSQLLLKQGPLTMLGSLIYSVAAQSLWVAGLLSIWKSLAAQHYAVEYVVLYCAASITGMIPLSVGGLGIKEMTYYYGAQLLQRYAHSGVDGDLGIAISLCIFFLMFATSLPGLLWLNKVEVIDHA